MSEVMSIVSLFVLLSTSRRLYVMLSQSMLVLLFVLFVLLKFVLVCYCFDVELFVLFM